MGNFPKLPPGTRLQVGSHLATIVDYLGEGGFAHIYKVEIDPLEEDTQIACLKRVIVPDKLGLMTLRKEVEVMKTLRHARRIVKYFDSHAERLDNGTYQVLVLMELCPNGLLLDYMNRKIKTKLTEPEILKIMVDIGIGVYEMHRLKLIHRDIKIENVLIDAKHRFKLCDFGSTLQPIMPPKDQQQFQLLSHDILYQTTPQYRAPEMIDLYRGIPIDDKADIWALGCFLYKLCYYTTPFEALGDIAILHALFQFLPQPQFLGDLKNLIIIMLQENPLFRPNIVQVLMLVAKIMRIDFAELAVDDFYGLGPYNFQALHDYQRHKQNEMLKQQQMYYQQHAAAHAHLLLPAPQPGLHPGHPPSYMQPHQLHTPRATTPLPGLAQAPPMAQQKLAPAAHLYPPLQQQTPQQTQGSSHHGLPATLPLEYPPQPPYALPNHAPLLELLSKMLGLEIVDVPDNELLGISDRDLIENVEERYPLLEDFVDPAALARQHSHPSSEGSRTPPDGPSRKSLALDKRGGEYSNKEAWELRTHLANLTDEAGKLADDIFAGPLLSHHLMKSVGSQYDAVEELDEFEFESAVVLRYPDVPDLKDLPAAPALTSPPRLPEPALPIHSHVPPQLALPPLPNVQQPVPQHPKNKPPPPVPQTQPVAQPLPQPVAPVAQPVAQPQPPQPPLQPLTVPQPVAIPQMAPPQVSAATQVSPRSNNPFPFTPSSQPSQPPAVVPYDVASASPAVPTERPQRSSLAKKSANPWGEYQRPNLVLRMKLSLLAQELLPMFAGMAQVDEQNLIDLDLGDAVPLSQRAKRSSDEGSDLETTKSRENHTKLKPKRLLSIPDTRANFDTHGVQEEVVDFASDDEENSSLMSRLNIRNSLKHSRRSGEYKRSEPSEKGSKRRSFFGSGSS